MLALVGNDVGLMFVETAFVKSVDNGGKPE